MGTLTGASYCFAQYGTYTRIKKFFGKLEETEKRNWPSAYTLDHRFLFFLLLFYYEDESMTRGDVSAALDML